MTMMTWLKLTLPPQWQIITLLETGAVAGINKISSMPHMTRPFVVIPKEELVGEYVCQITSREYIVTCQAHLALGSEHKVQCLLQKETFDLLMPAPPSPLEGNPVRTRGDIDKINVSQTWKKLGRGVWTPSPSESNVSFCNRH